MRVQRSSTPFRLSIVLMAVGGSGCAIVGSTHVPSGQASNAQGVRYMLPMARVPVKLLALEGQVTLEISEPVSVGDPDHAYVLQRMANPFSSDTVTIDVDPNTGFLTKVEAQSKDDTLQILEKLLLKGAAATKESALGQAEVIYEEKLDPANPAELNRASVDMTKALQTFLEQKEKACTAGASVCAEYKASRALVADRGALPVVKLEGRRAVASLQTVDAPAGGADCGVGVCYRQPQPFQFTSVLNGRQTTTLLTIPNASPVLALPIERHPFVTTEHTVTFDQGLLSQVQVVRPSSALALVSSPLAAVSGVLRAITGPLSDLLKIDTSGEAEAEAKENIAQAALAHDVTKSSQAAKKATMDAKTNEPPRTLATLTLGTRRNDGGVPGLVVGGGAAAVPAAAAKSASAPTQILPGSDGKK